jgi:hypothetical protein
MRQRRSNKGRFDLRRSNQRGGLDVIPPEQPMPERHQGKRGSLKVIPKVKDLRKTCPGKFGFSPTARQIGGGILARIGCGV